MTARKAQAEPADVFDGDRIEFADGRTIVLSELDERTREAVFKTVVSIADVPRLDALRDRVRSLYSEAVRRGHSIMRLAIELEVALKARPLTGRELVYILAGPRMLEREQAAEVLTARQKKGRATVAANAQAESDRRKRQWLKLRREIRRERIFESPTLKKINAEADKRLAKWLSSPAGAPKGKRGKAVTADTIANQRSREKWPEG